MCVPAIVNLYKQTKEDLFFNMEETLSYGRQTPANFQKIFSISTEPITVSPPRFVPLTLWVDGQYTDHATCSQYELLIHFTRISTNYTSLETNDIICFRNQHMFSKELVRIFPSHKQEHLLGTIVVTKKLNLIGNICFNSHRTSETHFLHQSASTEAIFSSTWNMHAKSLCSEKKPAEAQNRHFHSGHASLCKRWLRGNTLLCTQCAIV